MGDQRCNQIVPSFQPQILDAKIFQGEGKGGEGRRSEKEEREEAKEEESTAAKLSIHLQVRVALRQGQSVHLCICAFGPMPKCLNDKTVVGDFLISLVSSSRQRTKHVRHCCRETVRDRIDTDRVLRNRNDHRFFINNLLAESVQKQICFANLCILICTCTDAQMHRFR